MRYFAYIIIAIITLATPKAFAESQVFPPENWETSCAGGDFALTWDGSSSVKCKSAAELMAMALKKCASGQTLALNSAGTGVECKSSSVGSSGWWTGFFIRSHITTSTMHNCAPKCTGCQQVSDGQNCPIERGCVHFVDPDGSHGWRNCKIPEQQITVSCPVSGGGRVSVPLATEYIYRCTEPHLDTGGCSCPEGTSPVLYTQNYDTMACTGGYLRQFKCK